MNEDRYLIAPKVNEAEEIEVTRSFSMKRNLETHLGSQYKYESADYFCSAKARCLAVNAERKSALLDQYCKAEVLKAINKFESECLAKGKQHDRKTA